MIKNTLGEKVTRGHRIGYGIGDRILLLIGIGSFAYVGGRTYEVSEWGNNPSEWKFMLGVTCLLVMLTITLTHLDNLKDLIMGR
jgi:hypothetical protein